MPSLSEIRESIDARIAQARGEMTSLQAARAALHPNGTARVRTSTARPTAQPTRRRSSNTDGGATTATAATTTKPATSPKGRRAAKPASNGTMATAATTATSAAPLKTRRAAKPERDAGSAANVDQPTASGAPATEETSGPSTKPTTTPRKPRAAAQRQSSQPMKAVKVLLAGKLAAMLRDAADGLSVAAIARDASANQSQVRGLLRDLQTADQVRRVGAGRGTRWTLVTDEQRSPRARQSWRR
jgi:hypothetical protein